MVPLQDVGAGKQVGSQASHNGGSLGDSQCPQLQVEVGDALDFERFSVGADDVWSGPGAGHLGCDAAVDEGDGGSGVDDGGELLVA